MSMALEDVAERLRTLRKRAGVSLQVAAHECGCMYHTYRQYEHGDYWPATKHLAQIAEFYNCDLHWLLTGDAWEPVLRCA